MMDDRYANNEDMEMDDDENAMDKDILLGLSRRILDDPEGMNALVEAASNTRTPVRGAAQFITMMIQNVSEAVEQTGIPVNLEAWLANDGVVTELAEEVAEILMEAGIEVDPANFAQQLYLEVAEIGKGIAQAEEGAASPTAGASDMLAQAPLLGG